MYRVALFALLATPFSANARLLINEETWWFVPIHLVGVVVALKVAERKRRPMWFWGPFSATGWLAALVACLVPPAK